MIVDSISSSRARSHAIQAGIALLFSLFGAILKYRLVGLELTFLLSPLIIIYLWPRGADYVWSYFILFTCGLIFDGLSSGNFGFWPLVFLIAFAIVRPEHRAKDTNLGENWLNFIIWMGILYAVFSVLSLIGLGNVSYTSLAVMTIANICIFPLLFLARSLWRRSLIADED